MVAIFGIIKGLFQIEALRARLFYTGFVLAVVRLGYQIPLPGLDLDALAVLRDSFSATGLLGYFTTMAGGALSLCSVLSLGIGPYITASIMMQILTLSFPYLEALSKEGESGRAIISRYTRYLTVFVSLMQGAGYVAYIERGLGSGINLVLNPDWWFRAKALFILMVGSLFVMWLGEQISRFGIGQGSSILIFSTIVARIPQTIGQVVSGLLSGEISQVAVILLVIVITVLTACIIFLEKGERRVTVYYAKRVVNRTSAAFSGVASYIPFKINSVGVMPVILTQPMLGFLIGAFDYLVKIFAPHSVLVGFFSYNTWGYNLLTVVLIVFFNFSYMSLFYNPFDLSDNLKKSGGFLPGVRPGSKTAEYFDYLLSRIGTPGALYMAFLAILPGIIAYYLSLPIVFSGLSLLIAVGVALDTSAQIETYFIENRYDGFLFSGHGK